MYLMCNSYRSFLLSTTSEGWAMLCLLPLISHGSGYETCSERQQHVQVCSIVLLLSTIIQSEYEMEEVVVASFIVSVLSLQYHSVPVLISSSMLLVTICF